MPQMKPQTFLSDRLIEWYSAIVMMAWSITLAMPPDTLANPRFSAFARYGVTEEWWAAIFGIAGGARLAALYINGKWPHGPQVRMIGSIFGAVSWAQISWMLIEPEIARTKGDFIVAVGMAGPAFLTYLTLAIFELMSVYRAAFDARYHAS